MGTLANSEDADEMQQHCCILSGSAVFAEIKTTFRDRNMS